MSEILCSTGALIGRYNGRDYRLLEQFSKELDCDGFEFMIYASWYEEIGQLTDFLQRMNFNIPVIHCDKFIGQKLSEDDPEVWNIFERNCIFARNIGAKMLVLHLWNGPVSDKFIERNIAGFGKLSAIAKSYDLELLTENVVCNQQDPMTHWCELAGRYPDSNFIFDTKMAAFHHQMDLLYDKAYEWLWKENRIRHYHVNDYAGGYMDWQNLRTLPIGKGHIDFEKFFRHIKDIGYDGTFTIESTAFNMEGIVDTAMLNKQFKYIREQLK